MTNKGELYKCEHCGIIAAVVHAGGGKMICCGEPMKLVIANSVDAAKEKHVPVIEKTANGIKVKVGSVAHPMEEKHYIEYIEVLFENKLYMQYLKPGDKPEADFPVQSTEVTAMAYCNLHGLWKS